MCNEKMLYKKAVLEQTLSLRLSDSTSWKKTPPRTPGSNHKLTVNLKGKTK